MHRSSPFLLLTIALSTAAQSPPPVSAASSSVQPRRDRQVLPSVAASETDHVLAQAKEFFSELIAGNPAALVEKSTFPFYLEAKRITLSRELLQEWTRNLDGKRTDLLVLYGIEVLTPAEMEKKYGKPPKRLASVPWRGPDTYLAVANLSGHAAVAIFRRAEGAWKVAGFHD